MRTKPGQLCGHVVNGADEDAVPLERHLVLVLVGVVQAERLVDRGALVHELDGAAGVGGDVADGEQPMGEGRSACGRNSRYQSPFIIPSNREQRFLQGQQGEG